MGAIVMPAVVAPPTGLICGYIRESAGDAANDIEKEGQRETIRRLVARDGYDTEAIVWYDDWSMSGTRKNRPAYVRLRADIAEGRVAAVYARSVDRLGRDVDEGMAFEGFARTKGVRIVTDRDGERTGDPDEQNTIVRFLPHLVAAEESRLGRLRAKEGRATRLRNLAGHDCPGLDTCDRPVTAHFDGTVPYGYLPGEDLPAVIEAFEATGSYSGAAKRLNAEDVTLRRGTQWESTTVKRIIERVDATEPKRLKARLPVRTKRGSKTMSVHRFARLVTCPYDGSILTASNRKDRSGPAVGYFCRQGRQSAVRCPKHGTLVVRQPDWTWKCPRGHRLDRYAVVADHPRPWSVSEHVLITPIREALGSWVHHRSTVTAPVEGEADVEALQARKERIAQVYVDGAMSHDDYRAKLAAIDAELERLAVVVRTGRTHLLGINWSLTPEEVNTQLRDVLHSITLDPRMRPTGAVWLREPTIELDDGSTPPNPDATAVEGGWWLPFDS